MEVTTLDLRRRTAEIMAALERGEAISLTYRGRAAAMITPTAAGTADRRVRNHPFFGSRTAQESVETCMQRLRAPRHNAV